MDPHDEMQPAPARMAPPSDVETPYLQPQLSTWPRTLGILAIVFGALAVLGGVLTAVGQIFSEQFAKMAPEGQRAAMTSLEQWKSWIVTEQVLRVALGVLVIVAGAWVMQRRPKGVKWMHIWSGLKIVLVIGALALGLQTVDVQVAAMQQSVQGTQTPMSPAMMKTVAQFSLGLALLWGAALPVFMLIWFGRQRIKNEVSSWPSGDTSLQTS